MASTKTFINKIVQFFIHIFLNRYIGLQSITFLDYLGKYYKTYHSFSFIQVGANDGISHDILFKFIENKNKIKGIAIEPIQDYFAELIKNYLPLVSIVPINIAVHPYLKEVELYRLDKNKEYLVPHWAKGIASVIPKHHLKSNIPTDFIVKEKVVADTFMNIYRNYCSLYDKIDLVQIDVEGFDWEIIKMIDLKKVNPHIIKYEWVNLKKNDLIISCWYLKSKNYKLFIEGNDFIALKEDKIK